MCEKCVEQAVGSVLFQLQNEGECNDGQILTGLAHLIGAIVGADPDLDEAKREKVFGDICAIIEININQTMSKRETSH